MDDRVHPAQRTQQPVARGKIALDGVDVALGMAAQNARAVSSFA
jgi:hypothetical protein